MEKRTDRIKIVADSGKDLEMLKENLYESHVGCFGSDRKGIDAKLGRRGNGGYSRKNKDAA